MIVMTRFICLIFLLLSNVAFSKHSSKEATDALLAQLSTTREEIEKESLEWEKGFVHYLIDDADPNVQLLGYYKQLSDVKFDDNEKLASVGVELNLILSSNQLDKKSISTLTEICSYDKLRTFCDQEAIFAKQLQSMPDNAFIYLSSLSQAIKDDNQKGITQAIDDMADSKYFITFYYLHQEYRIKLEEYVKTHPFPKNKLAMERLEVNRYMCCNKIDTIDEMQDIMIHIRVLGAKMAESIPAYRDLTQVCLNDLSQEKSCLKLAELLITQSKSIISARIGYAIKINIFKQKGEKEKLQQATEDKTNYTKHYECLVDIMNYGKTALSSKGAEFNKIAEPIERKYGEVAYYDSLAQSNYNYYSNLGDTEINNPNNCISPQSSN